MHRRSAVTQLAATLTGLSLGRVPSLDAAPPSSNTSFAVTGANLPESTGTVTCPVCHQMGDSLDLTLAGPCLRCADRDATLRAEPRSDPFWALSSGEVRRLEPEIQRLAAELHRINDRLLGLRQMAEGSDVYDRAMEAGRDEWHALQRELHLLQLLRAASRQAVSMPRAIERGGRNQTSQ